MAKAGAPSRSTRSHAATNPASYDEALRHKQPVLHSPWLHATPAPYL